jgi:hypothetical protein
LGDRGDDVGSKALLFSEEKRSKKDFPRLRPRWGEQQMGKSFLVLFFKKEPLPSYHFST